MKRLTLVLGLLIILAGGAIARDAETVKVNLGQSRAAQNGGITVKFVSIVEDSRCPMNARCVWAGNASIKVAVSRPGRRAVVVQLNSNTKPQEVTVLGYRLSLQDLAPHKGQPANWPKRPIRATLTVERAS